MPPVKKFQKEDILKVAYEIVKEEGIKELNARKIAFHLGSSVQPIFHNFQNMEELTCEVYHKIYQKYQEYMTVDFTKEKSYKSMGLAYIRFASDYPEFFKLIFMQETNFNVEKFMMHDSMSDRVIQEGQKLTHFSFETQKEFHIRVWIFTHGIACLVASHTVQLQENEIGDLLESTVKDLLTGFRERGKK